MDTGLRLEGLRAFSLWCIVIDVSEYLAFRARSDVMRHLKSQASQTTQENMAHVAPNGQESSSRAHFFRGQ